MLIIILQVYTVKTMTEKQLESSFVRWCQYKKIVAIKGPAATAKGFPDRFLQLPNGGGTVYVEFKGTSYYGLAPLQLWWKEYIINSSPHRYFLVDNEEDLEQLKSTCEKFISIGPKLIAFEKENM
jgi:hypothetical protein